MIKLHMENGHEPNLPELNYHEISSQLINEIEIRIREVKEYADIFNKLFFNPQNQNDEVGYFRENNYMLKFKKNNIDYRIEVFFNKEKGRSVRIFESSQEQEWQNLVCLFDHQDAKREHLAITVNTGTLIPNVPFQRQYENSPAALTTTHIVLSRILNPQKLAKTPDIVLPLQD